MAFTYGTSKVSKEAYDVYIASRGSLAAWDGGTLGAWVKVGVCAEKPSIMTPQGDTYKLQTGDEPVISTNIQFEANVANVTADNYTALKALVNQVVSVQFIKKGQSAPTANTFTANANGIIANDVMIYPELNIISNDQNIIKITGKREVPVTDTSVAIGASI